MLNLMYNILAVFYCKIKMIVSGGKRLVLIIEYEVSIL